jgi:VIT1/CCC1 family predicted Fe2+/Mn2+ transporter
LQTENKTSNPTRLLQEHMYDNEATDALLYQRLAAYAKAPHNQQILQTMARDEQRHCALWSSYVARPPRVSRLRLFLFTWLARIFGLVFVLNLLENKEEQATRHYSLLSREMPEALTMLADEKQHEDYLISLLREERLNYISSMILGLNDALVELTGALAGFTLALNNNTMIGLAGFITGVAATLSMGASEYLAKKADPQEPHPLKAAVYTGVAYLITVSLLLLPYAIFSSPLLALAFCLLNAGLIILGFTYFVSVVRKTSFKRGFWEMLAISAGVALVSFLIGWAASSWLGLG